MNSVIIDPGIIPQELVLDSIRQSSYNVIAIGAETNIARIRKETKCNCYNYDYFLTSCDQMPMNDDAKAHYNKAFADVISDYKTLQIAERTIIRQYLWQNDFHDLILISKLVGGFLDVICSNHPAFVFFHTTPHEICSWTLGKVADSMGIPVYTTITTPLPWKSMLKCGLSSSKLVPIKNVDESEKNAKFADDYYYANKKKYDDAIPSYEKERIEARKGHFWSWKKEFLNCFKAKDFIYFAYHIYAMFRKHSLYKYYQSLAVHSLDLNEKYVVVFLHFQPERTSLPEGRFFTQQYHLIKTISLALPDGYRVYVKEHPSMFVNNMDIRYRTKGLYKDIASLKNVILVDIGIDSFTLIDRSVSIATITGTVGIQSFIRGKSVLCFGDASYVGFKHCYNINSVEDVKEALDSIDPDAIDTITRDFQEYLHDIDNHSLTGVTNNEIEDYYGDSYRLISGGKVLKELLCNMCYIDNAH